jgi:hypothetical protein
LIAYCKGRIALLLTLAVLVAAVAIPAAFAGNSPANKVNGDMWYDNSGHPAHWVFNAQDLGTAGAKGNVVFEDATWGSFTANVVAYTQVTAKKVTFSASVTSSTYGAQFGTPWVQPGDVLTWTVYDGGEGASGTGDYFNWLGVNGTGGTGEAQYPATSGNIQVHTS